MKRDSGELKPAFDPYLAVILALSAFLNIYGIWQESTSNSYYTAAVTSMLQSFHNFFYASFDPGGFVTVDKPPLALWVQTAFAYLFGVQGWSVILPQALANIASVLMVYIMVKPGFGRIAARTAALVMACSPIAVAVSRTNNLDSQLILVLLVAAWMLFRGIRQSSAVWIIGAFALSGLGFNIKMLQAYLVLPSFYLMYLLAFKTGAGRDCHIMDGPDGEVDQHKFTVRQLNLWMRLKRLMPSIIPEGGWGPKLGVMALATVVLIAVSLSWAVAVDSVPASERPYIGGSDSNSVLELALGYNGIQRLTGEQGSGPSGNQPGPMNNNNDPGDAGENIVDTSAVGPADSDSSTAGMTASGAPPSGMQGPPGNGDGNGGPGQNSDGGMFGTGTPGVLRFFQSELSGQISWMLPFAAFAVLALLAGIGRGRPWERRHSETLFWLAWLLTGLVFFSIASFFHHYYLIMLAPPLAALCGAGFAAMLEFCREAKSWEKWLLPLAIMATAAFEAYILWPYQSIIGVWTVAGLAITAVVTALALIIRMQKTAFSPALAFAGIFIILAAPLGWAATPLIYGSNTVMPQAGLNHNGGPGQSPGQMGGPNGNNSTPQNGSQPQAGRSQGDRQGGVDTELLEYLLANNSGEKFLFAVADAGSAEAYIIQTGCAVMAMGGFNGSDPILTVESVQQMVADGEIKYFMISGGGNGGGRDNSAVNEWIRANGTEISSDAWQKAAGEEMPADADSLQPGADLGESSLNDDNGEQPGMSPRNGGPMGDRGGQTLYLVTL